MRGVTGEPLGPAVVAARPIAQMLWRVVMALSSPSLLRSGSRNKVKLALTAVVETPLLAEAGA
jgi:hypothetical protein